ncbi:serine/threonine protein kinase [Synechococcus sp. PCC 7502]|uniref:serine/threonine-protein kinase n=1 Tax=Synechococcus sp. PCC 7502 TaxID=1173263 RepID=UPI00029FE8E5|nr:serine/threonine-protein kinase [Synechococcus sp. PCC 7502]AFY72751.1 serine/threonine protein kinase [Synechococcus sp. PCC 7502]
MTKSSQAKYRIIGLVGRGQFGRVFCARDRLAHNQLVALKELEPRRFPTNQFLRELRFLLSLRHPHIVSCISVDYSQNRRYLVMEYCEAGTLRNLIDGNLERSPSWQNNLPQHNLQQYLRLVIEILAGLKYAHSLNIVHCDIKPENVLLKLTKTGWQAKISDFGIARLAQENDKPDNNGSPGYMAPERFYGQYSHASDLYAVGVILYELLTKERPFSGNPIELMYAHLNQRVKVPDYVPDVLKTFLYKALEKLPARRFKSADQMQEQLEPILSASLTLPIGENPICENQALISNKPDPNTLSFAIVEKSLTEPIIALGVFAHSNLSLSFYSASQFLLTRRNLSSILNFRNSFTFTAKITDLAITQDHEFVITSESIGMMINNFQDYQVLYTADYNANQKFYWAIANQWLGVLTATPNSGQFQLQIQRLAKTFIKPNWKSLIISSLLKNSEIVALLAIDHNHLTAIISNSTASNIHVISRRGNLIATYALPVGVVMAIASDQVGRILVVTELNYLLLIDWRPYRLQRVELGYRPQMIKATKWGYITTQGETNSLLSFMDEQGNYVGEYAVTGHVEAIACISNNVLAIAVKFLTSEMNDGGGKLLLLDLRQLNLDLVF